MNETDQRAYQNKNKEYQESTTPLPTIAQTLKSMDYGECGRQSMADSIASQLHHARNSANKVERLERLIALLDKNPDLLEILDIVRGLGLL